MSLMPIVMIHVRGQYKMLCNYISMIGQEHRDYHGHRIFYTNIEKNEYTIKKESKLIPGLKPSQWQLLKPKMRLQKLYEANYLRQIIRSHQKLLAFQDEFTRVISPFMSILVVSNIVFFVLCLYQMVTGSAHISLLRYLKFVGVFLAIMLEFFLICCNSSEVGDECNDMMVSAIKQCGYEKCIAYQTRRDLCVLLSRVQRPNHLKFNQGTIVLSRILFLKVAKLTYSFVNFMRFNTSKGKI
uniref:Uncharacterized protein n=1 Tax=Cacopsylla melanoneura TaxID=428564 RepID=A0A8D8QBD2_9HEMI